MGQKVNPTSLRLGITKSWQSNWYSETNLTDILHEDLYIRKYLDTVYKRKGFITGLAQIERSLTCTSIKLPVSEPLNLSKESVTRKVSTSAVDTEKLKKVLEEITSFPVSLCIQNVDPSSSAVILSKDIALKLEQRLPFSPLMKRYMKYATSSSDVKGVKIQCSGRLNGEDIARTEWVKEGQIPLHTLSSNIEYGFSSSYTVYGVIGIKIWICRGGQKENIC